MKVKMEKRVIVVCSVVGFLALLSAVTGFVAEAKKLKVQVSTSFSPCNYPRSPAYGLGLTSAVALMIAEITISVASGCICCFSKGPHQSHSNWSLALVCFVVSWFGSVVAFLVLLVGAFLNDKYDGDQGMPFGYYVCPAVKPGAFAGAGLLSLASIMLGLVYYLILTAEKKPVDTTQGSVAMGQPQFPSPVNSQDPVFVHEDTYARRQLV